MEKPDVRSQRSRERWFTAIVCAGFVFAIGTPAIQSLTAPKYQTAVGQQTIPLSGVASLVSKAMPFVIVGLCLSVIALYIRWLPRTGAASLIVLLLPWLYLAVRDKYGGAGTHINELCYPLIGIATWFLRPRLSALKVLGYLVGATAILSIAMGFVLPLKGIYQSAAGAEISLDKQLFSSGILVGPLSSGNNLGQFLLMGTASILLVPRRRWRAVMLIASIYAQLWAASRSCLAAAAVMIVLALALRALPRPARSVAAAGTLLGLAAVLVFLPFLTTDPTAFSNRGYVWQVSKQAWAANRWFGLGSDYYGRVAATSANLGGSVFHGHNQLVHDLVTGGYVLAVLMGLVVAVEVVVATRLVRLGHDFGALYLVGFLGACVLEVSYVLVDRYFALPVMVIPFACILFTADRDGPRSELLAQPVEGARGTAPAASSRSSAQRLGAVHE